MVGVFKKNNSKMKVLKITISVKDKWWKFQKYFFFTISNFRNTFNHLYKRLINYFLWASFLQSNQGVGSKYFNLKEFFSKCDIFSNQNMRQNKNGFRLKNYSASKTKYGSHETTVCSLGTFRFVALYFSSKTKEKLNFYLGIIECQANIRLFHGAVLCSLSYRYLWFLIKSSIFQLWKISNFTQQSDQLNKVSHF